MSILNECRMSIRIPVRGIKSLAAFIRTITSITQELCIFLSNVALRVIHVIFFMKKGAKEPNDVHSNTQYQRNYRFVKRRLILSLRIQISILPCLN